MVSSFGGEILAASTETALTDITSFFLQEVKWSVQMRGRFLPYPFRMILGQPIHLRVCLVLSLY